MKKILFTTALASCAFSGQALAKATFASLSPSANNCKLSICGKAASHEDLNDCVNRCKGVPAAKANVEAAYELIRYMNSMKCGTPTGAAAAKPAAPSVVPLTPGGKPPPPPPPPPPGMAPIGGGAKKAHPDADVLASAGIKKFNPPDHDRMAGADPLGSKKQYFWGWDEATDSPKATHKRIDIYDKKWGIIYEYEMDNKNKSSVLKSRYAFLVGKKLEGQDKIIIVSDAKKGQNFDFKCKKKGSDVECVFIEKNKNIEYTPKKYLEGFQTSGSLMDELSKKLKNRTGN